MFFITVAGICSHVWVSIIVVIGGGGGGGSGGGGGGVCYWSWSIPSPLDSILLAVLTVSPNKQYLGMDKPTIPVNTHTYRYIS